MRRSAMANPLSTDDAESAIRIGLGGWAERPSGHARCPWSWGCARRGDLIRRWRAWSRHLKEFDSTAAGMFPLLGWVRSPNQDWIAAVVALVAVALRQARRGSGGKREVAGRCPLRIAGWAGHWPAGWYGCSAGGAGCPQNDPGDGVGAGDQGQVAGVDVGDAGTGALGHGLQQSGRDDLVGGADDRP